MLFFGSCVAAVLPHDDLSIRYLIILARCRRHSSTSYTYLKSLIRVSTVLARQMSTEGIAQYHVIAQLPSFESFVTLLRLTNAPSSFLGVDTVIISPAMITVRFNLASAGPNLPSTSLDGQVLDLGCYDPAHSKSCQES
jgi:hypothetical protein